MKKTQQYVLYMVLGIVLLFGVVSLITPGGGSLMNSPKDIKTSDLRARLTGPVDANSADSIKSAEWTGNQLTGTLQDGTRFRATIPSKDSPSANEWEKMLSNANVDWKYQEPSPFLTSIGPLLTVVGPAILLFILLYVFVFRPAQMGGNQAINFGRSKARRVGENGPKVTFDDVAGIDEAKQELYEIVDFLKNTKKYTALGAKIPKGILLTGPPGVGKTHLARAIAGEAGVPFFHISGSDFVEMFVGVGAARVRDLFETAKAHRPSLIFVDEIDAVGRQRGAGLGGGHDEREQTLNQLLVEMDGFDPNSGVILIAATNRPDVLDPALLRPGRFDRQIVVDAPDSKGREAILKIHAKGKPLDSSVNLSKIAKRSPGFTGADLANTLNEAALLAARKNRSKISHDEIEEALDRTMMGPARRSKELVQKDRELTAVHEAGHAVIGELLEHCDPIHKVTILPRGFAMGITWSMPDVETMSISRTDIIDRITMALGGLVAEETVFGERWTGATNDLQRVTRMARAMVCEYGMSEKLGTLAIGHRHNNPFLGRDVYEDRDYSDAIAEQIDLEVRDIVDRCYQRAIEMLKEHREQLDAVTNALLEFESLDREEFLAVMRGDKITREPAVEDSPQETHPQEEPRLNNPTPRLEPGPA